MMKQHVDCDGAVLHLLHNYLKSVTDSVDGIFVLTAF